MAHKKGQGSSKNGRDSNAQYRGVKLYGGQSAKAGSIIVRQCGTHFKPGYLVQRCKDDTLMARVEGTVRFRGREMAHRDIGELRCREVASAVEDVGQVETRPSMEGRQMFMIIAPRKK